MIQPINKKVRRILTIFGLCLVIVGVILFVVGLTDTIASIRGQVQPTRFFLVMVGLLLTSAGLGLLLYAVQGKIASYLEENTIPLDPSSSNKEQTEKNNSCGDCLAGEERNDPNGDSSSYQSQHKR